jgi:hypothetical protein
MPCDDGNPCTLNDTCLITGFPMFPGGCFTDGTLKTCPDSDGNPCTTEVCNPLNGQCQVAPFPIVCLSMQGFEKADPQCVQCTPNGTQVICAITDFIACNDFNDCTGDGQCASDGECLQGTPISASPTPTIGQATSTPTRTATPTVPATVTATVPGATATATRSATVPVPTSTVTVGPSSTPAPTLTPPPFCVGDCDATGRVDVLDLIRAVNIALGIADLSRCMPADADSNGTVEIQEVVLSVRSSLDGCPPSP